jgi:hypothetical protein
MEKARSSGFVSKKPIFSSIVIIKSIVAGDILHQTSKSTTDQLQTLPQIIAYNFITDAQQSMIFCAFWAFS